ncbi:MAG: protein translocase subunit SecD [Solirubrobacteraceae bacterium]|nr:protein translocase subunit SecD [Solirubrobacteraceae bacterium]
MTDRRRNVFVLLFVLAMVIASGVVVATKETKLGLDLRGGVQLIYQATPAKGQELSQDAIQRTIDVMQERVNGLGVTEAEIQQSGSDQIDVSLPAQDDPEEAERSVGTTAQMAFYDWEASIVGDEGVVDPSDPQITGTGVDPNITGLAGERGSPLALSQYDAIMRVKNLKPKPHPNSIGEQFYVVDDRAKKVVVDPKSDTTLGPYLTEEALRESRGYRNLYGEGGEPKKGQRIVNTPDGYRVVQAADGTNEAGEIIPAGDKWFAIVDDPKLLGRHIKDPAQSYDQGFGGGKPNVVFDFTDEGRKIWRDVTREIVRRGSENCVPQVGESRANQVARCANHFAVVLDNQLITTPYIDFVQNPTGIGGSGGSQISGSFTVKSAQSLARLLQAGSLPLTLELIAQQQVSATLGQEALDQGLIAGIAGFAVVALFLLVFYRVLGLIAVTGLAVYTLFFLALVKLVPIVLTLPGIAGLILTIAVAADANVVIFERVKDELQAGRSPQRAIRDGYRKGLSAIIDGNAITFLVAFILFLIATAGVKGFALNLGVGVVISMVTAVVLTQAVLGVAAQSSTLILHPAALGARKRNPIWHRFDFVGASKWFFAASGVILLIGAVGIGAKGLNFGIDFESGTKITAVAKQGTTVDDVRNALRTVGEGDAKIQQVTASGPGAESSDRPTFQIQTEALTEEAKRKGVTDQLAALGVNPRADLDFNTVGPTFGQTVARLAVIAIIASFTIIAFVIWARFSLNFTVPILIAVTHDLLITAGIYALTGAEVTASTVAALLTIIGYSLYDTIIVFDRIRENMKRLPSATFSQIVNRSMSEVLGRSLVTSFSTGLPTLALYLFGGDTLKDFALAMLIGTISGAYSSVFIASPVLAAAVERSPAMRLRHRRALEAGDGYIPPYPGGEALEDEPRKRKRRTLGGDGPTPGQAVGADDFKQMVDELGLEESPAAAKTKPARTKARRSQAAAKPEPASDPDAGTSPDAGEGAEGEVQRAADLNPEDLVLKDDPKHARRRKRPHGRPR